MPRREAAPSRAEGRARTRSKVAQAAGRRAFYLRIIAGIVGLGIVIAIVDVVTHGDFLTAENLTNVLRQITYNAIVAVGQTFVIITAGIDLSVGSLIELTGVVMATFANAMPFGGIGLIVATLIVGLAVGCGAGLVNALPVVRLNLPPFITTLAMMLMARGLAFKLSHGQPIPLHSDAFQKLGTGYVLGSTHVGGLPGIPIAVLWMAAIFIIFGVCWRARASAATSTQLAATKRRRAWPASTSP